MDETGNPKALNFGLIFGGILLIGIIIAILITRSTDEGMYKQLKNGDLEDKKEAIEYFVESGDDFAMTALSEALQDQDVFVRVTAAEMLGNLNNEKSVELLADALYHDKVARVSDAAIKSLTQIGGKACADLLIPVLEDEDSDLRISAITALGKIGDESHVEPLIKLLTGTYGSVADTTIEALISLGSKAVPALAAELNSRQNQSTRIVYILCNIDDPQAYDVLAARCDGDPQFVAENYKLFIKRGHAGDEVMLVEALMSCGTESMAEDYLNCGNGTLEDAAKEWADQNGYYVLFGSSSSNGITWGQD